MVTRNDVNTGTYLRSQELAERIENLRKHDADTRRFKLISAIVIGVIFFVTVCLNVFVG